LPQSLESTRRVPSLSAARCLLLAPLFVLAAAAACGSSDRENEDDGSAGDAGSGGALAGASGSPHGGQAGAGAAGKSTAGAGGAGSAGSAGKGPATGGAQSGGGGEAGSTETENSAGATGGGGDGSSASGGLGGTSGGGGAGAGGSAGAGVASDCPSTAPEIGSACGVQGLDCSFGDSPFPECRDHVVCSQEKWGRGAGSGACEEAPPGVCPDSVPPAQSECSSTDLGARCAFDDGSLCTCVRQLCGGAGCTDLPYPQWNCSHAAPGCPLVAPNAGTSCAAPATCEYEYCGLLARCVDGTWHWLFGCA
jgi:hypothetical protein